MIPAMWLSKSADKKIKSSDHALKWRVFEHLCWNKIVLILIIFIVLYRRFATERSLSPLIPEPKFKPLRPNDTTLKFSSSDNADYSRLIDMRNFNFELNHFPCDDAPNGLLLLVLVSSNPSNYEKRNVIRKTWGHSTEATRVVFLLGNATKTEVTQKIIAENELHGDIIQGNFEDAYRNMTYKHVMGLKWITYHCPNARYILKMDDDTVVNIDEFHRFLTREISPWGAEDLIACQLLENTRALRSYRSKWRVSPLEYAPHYYPTYCAGWAILYSGDVVHRLYTEAQKTDYFWIDDVQITGILAERANILRTSFGHLQLSKAKLEMLKAFNYNPEKGVFLFGPPDLTASLMNDLWNLIVSTV